MLIKFVFLRQSSASKVAWLRPGWQSLYDGSRNLYGPDHKSFVFSAKTAVRLGQSSDQKASIFFEKHHRYKID